MKVYKVKVEDGESGEEKVVEVVLEEEWIKEGVEITGKEEDDVICDLVVSMVNDMGCSYLEVVE
jgi:hypothetical protein